MAPDKAEFAALTSPYRRELLVHCYRMTGSAHEAEDLVQETYLRAWRSYDAFEGRASLRTFLYRIATNACLTALEQRSRRFMPADPGAGSDPGDRDWLEPMPDALLTGAGDPAAVVESRTGVRLAFIAALQHLPPVRRAVLILRDVLSWRAAEVADVLDLTTVAVNSSLLRARAQIARVAPVAEQVAEPPEAARRALLDRYVAAFQDADIAALVRLLRADIALEMPPLPRWFRGRHAVAEFLATNVLVGPGDIRMVPTSANGQPAFLAYRRDRDGVHRPHAVQVLTLDATGVTHIAVFLDPAVCDLFPEPLGAQAPAAAR
jgi:RNA polymerase sigma-70 factor (ECF subfamily)